MQSNENPLYEGAELLSEIDDNLLKYSSHIVSLFSNQLVRLPQSNLVCIDFGAGKGSLAEIWAQRNSIKPICVEIDPTLVDTLKDKGFEAYTQITDVPQRADFIFTSNVLEHIENDVTALKQISEKLKSTGLLAIYVPAFSILFSKLDMRVGHFRRYSRTDLLKKLDVAGFEIISSNYSDWLGFFVTLILKYLGFGFSNGKTSSALMKVYDKLFVPISIFGDWLIFRKIVGKNIIVIAKLKSS